MGGTVVQPQPKSSDGTPLVADRNLVLGQESFKRVDNGTEQMNVDGLPAGTPTNIWDGDGSYWTASGTGSATTGSAHSGTYGWDTGVAGKDVTTTFDNGSMIDVAGSYETLKWWLNTQAFPAGSKLEAKWLDSGNSQVGNKVDISAYITSYDIGVWQQVIIPITDFALSGNVQKLELKYAKEAGQQFWFDEFALYPTGGGGGPYTFRIAAPDSNTIYHLSMMVLMVSDDETGWDHDNFVNITGLTNGLLLRHIKKSTSEVLWSFNSRDNTDLFGRYHPQESFTFNNGRLLVGFMVKPGVASVLVTDDDVLEFVVRDDLSSIDSIRAYAHYGIEDAS